MKKKFLIVFLLCPITWFLITHFQTALYEWGKTPQYLHQGISTLFSIDKIRYSVELNSDAVISRIFYNKISYRVGIVFHSLSVASPANIFTGQISIIFLPFWFVGIYKLIKLKMVWWFLGFGAASIFVFLKGQTGPYFLIFIVPFYIYAICVS